MAENFDDVIKTLGSTVKKPSASKAPLTLAVQIVDSKGKVVKEDKGAAAAEQQREQEKRDKKTNTLLSQILKAFNGGGNGEEGKNGGSKGGGLFAGLGGGALGAGIGAAMGGVGKMIGPAALLAGVAMAIKDAIGGYFKSEEWGVGKLSATIGGLFGGMDSGLKGALWGGMKWALIGAGIGSVVPVIGTAIGGAIGALLGALLGFIGGEKIAKFIDNAGTWLNEKWDMLKEFPGKIWTAIVDTVKGWIGLTPTGEVPVTVDADKPIKGWLDSIIDFLIPQWLIDFAKDALGTVTGWLGLTEKDDQGEITTTRFGKLVFGTIGLLSDFALSVINFFIPQFVKDFVASPLTTVLTWIGIKEADQETGEVTTTEFGKKLFSVVTKVTDFLRSIIIKVIGQDTYDGIIAFATKPLDYVLVNWLGWKTATGEATEKGIEAVKDLEEGEFVNFFTNIVKSIIGESTYNAIVGFAKNPVNYIMVNWLGWKTATGELTTTGMEAMEKLDEGKIGDFWTQLLRKIIGGPTYDAIVAFVKDPIDYVFTKWLGLKSKDDKKSSTGEKALVIAGTAVGLWEKLLKAILPDGIVDFIMSPINWAFGLFGLDKPGDTLKSVEEAHGLTIGDEESRTGMFGKILAAILPAGLIKFFKNPLDWLLEKFLGVAEAAKLKGAGVIEGTQNIIKKTTASTVSLFDQIIEKVIPQALRDFMESPIDYILKEWMGIDLDAKPSGPIQGPPAPAKEKRSLGDMLFDAMTEEGSGMGWLTKADDAPWYRVGISRQQLRDIAGLIGMAKGGSFAAGQPMLVGEAGPEMILPNQGGQVLNAQRTQQMLQAGLERNMGGAGGGGITSVNTGGNVVSAPTTNYVNNGIAARRPILLTA